MIWIWTGFFVFVLAMLALDLGVFHRHAHAVSVKEALAWSAVWVTLSLLFSVFVYLAYANHWGDLGLYAASDPAARSADDALQAADQLLPQTPIQAAVMYLTGYIFEYSLSVDNIFVIALVFGYFKIPAIHQHRVLFWGILGAVVMRGLFIGAGYALIQTFHWIIYLFGAFLIYTAYQMVTADEDPDPSKNFLVRLAHRYFPITPELHGQHFVVRESAVERAARKGGAIAEGDVEAERSGPVATTADLPGDAVGAAEAVAVDPAATVADESGRGKWVLTPLALALIVVEGTDVIFAVDSIPAIFAVTHDPFLVFTSNIFAVLGLRSLYFALAGILDKFYYLKTSLAVVLGLIGLKMIFGTLLHRVPWLGDNLSFVTLGLIVLILAAGVGASLVRARREERAAAEAPPAG